MTRVEANTENAADKRACGAAVQTLPQIAAFHKIAGSLPDLSPDHWVDGWVRGLEKDRKNFSILVTKGHH